MQNIPPNLWQVAGECLGTTHPVATVPSLSWLLRQQDRQQLRSGSRKCWLPMSADPLGALTRLGGDLRESLAEAAVDLITSRMPDNCMRGADLCIVCAHGGLHEGQSWFRVIADEDATYLSGSELASFLTGCGIVVLFVCSGGRLDRHPFTAASVGLPKLLLDRGCRTIVASPWPLDVAVPGLWLPSFLKSLSAGGTTTNAVFDGNQAVAATARVHPALCLAMNVYGDPFSTLTPPP
ncbi:MAG: CHAT domain-containing protein [Myxococcales bacterium]|nr:CHAT domain-containing protein [Myxococcales bacterium]